MYFVKRRLISKFVPSSSNFPLKPSIHANGVFFTEISLHTFPAVKGINNKPADPATIFAAMRTIEPVFPGRATYAICFGLAAIRTKTAVHNFPAVLQFCHYKLPSMLRIK